MSRVHLITGGFLLFLFLGIAAGRIWTSGDPQQTTSDESQDEARHRTFRFWELHREAGARRIAGEYDHAIRLYEEALALNPRHEDALYYLANAYLESHRLEDAEATLERLTREHPSSSRGHARLGELHLCFADRAVFDPERAEAGFRRALEVNSEETGPMLRLAEVALIRERSSQARQWLEAVLGTHATSVEAHFLLGYLAWLEGAPDVARNQYTRAHDLISLTKPSDPVVGEGDRKTGSSIKPGELQTCPVMLELLKSVLARPTGAERPPPASEAYLDVDRRLADLRLLSSP